MQYVLIAVSILSAAVAVVMCAIVIRMLRNERRRSDARVEALLAMAGDEPLQPGHAVLEPADATPFRSVVPSPPGSAPRSAAVTHLPQEPSAADFDLHSPANINGIDNLFAEREASSPWGRRLAAAAGCAALVTVVALALGSWGSRAEAPATTVATADSAAVPLQLLSLRHSAESRGLTITGLVQNPRAGATVSDVTAIAFLFGEDGAFLGSGRAPLDFTQLKPGDESPFVVQVPVTRGVARYRVSFRNKEGAVMAHVDRRGAGPLAQKE